jgi:hypothetical protein
MAYIDFRTPIFHYYVPLCQHDFAGPERLCGLLEIRWLRWPRCPAVLCWPRCPDLGEVNALLPICPGAFITYTYIYLRKSSPDIQFLVPGIHPRKSDFQISIPDKRTPRYPFNKQDRQITKIQFQGPI